MTKDLEERIKQLEERVQDLSDREEIHELRYRYHEYINEVRYHEIPHLFADDAEVDLGHLGHAKGKEEITDWFTHEQPKLLSFAKQFNHNHIIHLDGARATGVSYIEAKSIHKGESYLVAGKYDDEYVKQNGEWKFKRMVATGYFMVPLREGWAQDEMIKMGK